MYKVKVKSTSNLVGIVYSLDEGDRNILLAPRIYSRKHPDARLPQSTEELQRQR